MIGGFVIGVLSLGVWAGPASAQAADASLDGDGDRYEWTGTAPVASNPTPGEPPVNPCIDRDAGVCDYEDLEIVGQDGAFRVAIGISTNGADTDDYDLYVYDEAGELVGSSATGGSDELVELYNPAPGTYEIAVQPYLVDEGSTYSGVAEMVFGATETGPYDLLEDDCLEPVPARIDTPYIEDVGQRVELDVLVLLDGITQAEAEPHMADANRSYAAIGIDMAITYDTIDIPSDGTNEGRDTAEGTNVNQLARAQLNGTRPAGIDIVYTLTSKDLWSVDGEGRSYGLLGVADCIGGVRWDHRSFATGEITSIEGANFQGLTLFPIRGYRTTAHEIGHLMGAHHHYFNCVEGIPTEAEDGEVSPCTIMAPYVDLQSDNFGQAEITVIRGHALAFAADDAPPPVVPEGPGGAIPLLVGGMALIVLLRRRSTRTAAA